MVHHLHTNTPSRLLAVCLDVHRIAKSSIIALRDSRHSRAGPPGPPGRSRGLKIFGQWPNWAMTQNMRPKNIDIILSIIFLYQPSVAQRWDVKPGKDERWIPGSNAGCHSLIQPQISHFPQVMGPQSPPNPGPVELCGHSRATLTPNRRLGWVGSFVSGLLWADFPGDPVVAIWECVKTWTPTQPSYVMLIFRFATIYNQQCVVL